jgi:hypothetical protein
VSNDLVVKEWLTIVNVTLGRIVGGKPMVDPTLNMVKW